MSGSTWVTVHRWGGSHCLESSVLLSRCPPKVPTHTTAAQPQLSPIQSLARGEKKRHSAAPYVPQPWSSILTRTPPMPPFCAVCSHHSALLSQPSPPLLKRTHIRATLAYVRDRPRCPRTLPPSGGEPGHPQWRPWCAPRGSGEAAGWPRLAPVLICHAVRHMCPKMPASAVQDGAEPRSPSATNRAERRRN